MPLEKIGTINFIGGKNTRVDATNIKSNEFTELRNVNLLNGTLKRRDGFTKRGTIKRLVGDSFAGNSYISIPAHADYNTYHVGSAYEDLSMYFQIQIQLTNSSGYVGTPLPLIQKKDSFFLFIDSNDRLNLYYKNRNSDTLITSPYTLTDLHSFVTGNSAVMSIGLQFNNGSGSNIIGIAMFVDGMYVVERSHSGSGGGGGAAFQRIWDDDDAPNHDDGPIYLGYYDGIDYSGIGSPFNAVMNFTGRMLDFRIYRTDSTSTFELAVSDDHKKRYCWGNLPASKVTDAFLKGYWKLGDDHSTVVTDSDANGNDGTFIPNGGTRTKVNIGTINTRFVKQFRRQLLADKFLIDGGQAIYEEEGDGDFFPVYFRDPDLINTNDGITPTYTTISEMEVVNNRAHIAVGEETPVKHDGNTIVKLGIAPPSTAPVLISIASGLPDGVYKWRYTFYRSDIGLESNVSPEYTVTLYNQWVRFYLERPKDRQIDQIRLYRTIGGGTTLLLHTTFDAFTTYGPITTNDPSGIDITDNNPDSALGTVEAPSTFQAPARLKFLAEHHERLFGMGDPDNPSRLYFSNAINVEYFTASDYIDIGLTEEGVGTGLNYARDKIFIFKEKAIWQLYGTTKADFFTQYLNKEVGCIAQHSRVMVGDMIYFASVDGVYTLDGNTGQVENISEKIKPDYLNLNLENASTWIGILNKRYNQYMLITDTDVLVYDYAVKAWNVWDLDIEASDTFFESGQDEVYTAYDVDNVLYVFKQNDGVFDGANVDGDVHEYTTTTIKNTHLSLGDVTGFPLYVFKLDGTYQRRKIISNTTDTITVDTAFSPALSAGYKFAIGGIPVIMETGWLDIGNPQRHKIYRAVDFVYASNSSSKIVMAFAATDHSTTYDSTKLLDFTSGSGNKRWSMLRRGQFMKLKIFAPVGGFAFEIKKIIYGVDSRYMR